MNKPVKKKRIKRIIVLLSIAAVVYFGRTPIIKLCFGIDPPADVPRNYAPSEVIVKDGVRYYNNNVLRKNSVGVWEMYLEGEPFVRGEAFGAMASDLLKYQEDAFVEQIKTMIPSDFYLRFLRDFIAIFNRKLPDNVTDEMKKEIYGVSLHCTRDYDAMGSPYERQLNYHAAHDLGHAMQDYMLVGCTSFAVKDGRTEDSTLLVGRNFDFYAGDKFAENKIVAFYNPAEGYKFASITWPGMTGVISGMNEKGLTVTINAAKSTMPLSSATPISLLCREILQYASNIEEARAIAGRRRTFVSESILIGSAEDRRAEIIEKSPDKIGYYSPDADCLTCTNHFQSDVFAGDKTDNENIETSDSRYRQLRTEELIRQSGKIDYLKAADILRNKEGTGNKNIGLGNEKAINQLICHHSVIFSPEKLLMWVSSSPWQAGSYVCYDLNRVFSCADFSNEINVTELTIPCDTFLYSAGYADFVRYKQMTAEIKKAIDGKTLFDADSYISTNPEMYRVYELVGDYRARFGRCDQASKMYETALSKEIPKKEQYDRIAKKLRKTERKISNAR